MWTEISKFKPQIKTAPGYGECLKDMSSAIGGGLWEEGHLGSGAAVAFRGRAMGVTFIAAEGNSGQCSEKGPRAMHVGVGVGGGAPSGTRGHGFPSHPSVISNNVDMHCIRSAKEMRKPS